jgi:RNA polymerase-binding transcription factor DksA
MAAKKKSTAAKSRAKKKPAAKKAAAKKSPAKKTPAKKSPAKKTPAKKSPAKKAAEKKSPAKKAAAKKSPAKTTPAKKSPAKKAAVKKAPKTAAKPAEEVPEKPKKLKPLFKKRELNVFRQLLLEERARIVGDIHDLSGDNLKRSSRDSSGDLSNYGMHMADHGTDNFQRDVDLSLVGAEQDTVYEIDAAIRRIDRGRFGYCEMYEVAIEKERLKAIPYARFSLKAQAEIEKFGPRYRPFGQTMVHTRS